jgi:hypothetical protein
MYTIAMAAISGAGNESGMALGGSFMIMDGIWDWVLRKAFWRSGMMPNTWCCALGRNGEAMMLPHCSWSCSYRIRRTS